MNPTRAKKSTSIILAGALALALPGAALAASSAPVVANESLTVLSTITFTGAPTSIAYGSALGGATATGPRSIITFGTNSANGARLTVDATALTSGANSIAASNRSYLMGWEAGGQPTGGTLKGGAYTGAGFVLANTTGTANATVNMSPQVNVPASAVPGAGYTGTSTFTVVEN